LDKSNTIISELLDFARIPVLNEIDYLLSDAVEAAFEGLEIPAGVRLEKDYAAEVLHCQGDAGQVSRIVANLMRNGVQAMETGGVLSVRTFLMEDACVVEVRDTGCGIEQDVIGKIFEPLYTSKVKGIGLGLAIALRYAGLNGGELEVESEPGEGSVFRLTLPIQKSK
jgi:signal transduction histidine kinase